MPDAMTRRLTNTAPTRPLGADATGIACPKCGGAVAIEIHTVRGVTGVACTHCDRCGMTLPIPRRRPTAAERASSRERRAMAQRPNAGTCIDCGLPTGGRGGERCGHCAFHQRLRQRKRRRRVSA